MVFLHWIVCSLPITYLGIAYLAYDVIRLFASRLMDKPGICKIFIKRYGMWPVGE